MKLRPMLSQEYAQRLPRLIEQHSVDFQLTPERMRERYEQRLPQGVDTPGNLLFVGEVDGAEVGWIWVALPDEQRRMAWIYFVETGIEHRGKGYGRALIEAVERELVARGVDRLGLNVHGHNTVARALYESMGFVVTEQQMAKPLPEHPA